MGWGVYDDGFDGMQNAERYWSLQSDAANKYASFFMYVYSGLIWNRSKVNMLGSITVIIRN